MEVDLGVVCTGGLGWRTVRNLWERHLPTRVPGVAFYHPEDYGNPSRNHGFRTLCRLLATRRAAQAALRSGHRRLLVAAIGESGLLPRGKAELFIYGDSTLRQYRELYFKGRMRPKDQSQVARIRRLGARFFCMSEWYAQAALQDFGAGPDRVSVVPGPVDDALFGGGPVPHDGFAVAFVGGEFARKGGDLVLEASRDPRLAGCRWHIVTSDAVPTTPNVVVHSALTPMSEGLIGVLRQCDLFVLPTRADCSPNAVLEAMAAGLPTVVTDVGGCAELVAHGRAGTLLARPDASLLADAVKGYRDDPGLRQRHAEAGKARVAARHAIGPHIDSLLGAMR